MAFELITDLVLPRLIAASVQSTLLVALVWALCRALPRLSAAARCWLWWLVALQLVVGVVWASPLALPLLPAELAQVAPVAAQTLASPLDVISLDAAAAVPEAALASTAPQLSSVSSAWSWSLALAVLWLLGLSVMVARTLRGYMDTRKLLRESKPCQDTSLLHALELAAEAHGLHATPQLRVSSAIDSPQLIGPWRPVLLLPMHHLRSMQADELDMALTHELVHLQRRDLWWGLLPALAQHLFFFHPLAHLAAREYALAREAACDAAVIEGNRHCAHDYGRLLVRLGVAPRPSAGLASASPNFHVLKRRLVMLQDTARLPRVIAVLITLSVAVFGVLPYRITAAPALPIAAPAPIAVSVPVAAVAKASPMAVVVQASTSVPAPPAAPKAPKPPKAPPAVPARAAIAAPAAPPAPPTALRGTFTLNNSAGERAYVLLRDDDSVAMGTRSDLREAQALRRGSESLLWLRKGDTRYLVRDAATLARFRDSYAEVMRLGEAQGELGTRQGKLGEQQGKLGERQGEIGMRMAELAVAGKHKQLEATRAAMDAQQKRLGEEMEVLGKQQSVLGREQAVLGEKQKAASIRAEREAAKLMDEAIAKGVAQPIKR